MHLHGGFGNADIARNLFAKAAVRDLNHDLALPGGGQSFFVLPPSAIAREAELNGVEELLITQRLRKKLNGTTLHRLHRHGDIAVPCDEDDWQFLVRRGELALKIKTASPGQPDVEDKAGGAIRRTSGGSDLRKKSRKWTQIAEHPGRAIATDAQPMREGVDRHR